MYTDWVEGGVEFEWDEGNTDHISLHDVTPEEVEHALRNNPVFLKTEERHGERRDNHLGVSESGKLMLIFTTPRHGKVRVVTAWKANRKWRSIWKNIQT